MKYQILFLLISISARLNAQIIPLSRTVDWSHAGYPGEIPDSSFVTDISVFGGVGDSITDNTPFITNAINSLNGNRGVIYFPPGNYLIQSTLDLPDSVILRGSSSDSTHLIFDFAGTVRNCINISGSSTFPFTNVLSGGNKGSHHVIVADASGFTSGDYAELQEDNGPWDTQPVSWADNSIGQILHIETVSGDTLFFGESLRINYDTAFHVQIRKIVPAREVGMECLNLYRRDSIGSGFCVNIYFDHAVNCWIRGIESSRSIGSHVEVEGSSHIEITGSYFHHAFAYDGTSTHGYGITLYKHASDCKLENNIMRHLRHSFSFQCGANGNVVSYNYSINPHRSEPIDSLGADISMHGHYSFANLFEGNIVQNIQIDQTWGPTGPFNTFFRNRAELFGILMTSGTVNSDSENFVGNEITNMGPFMGNYALSGNGHFEFANNVRGIITSTGLTDSSYYLQSVPSFWNIGSAFPSVGDPIPVGSGSIPARDRYLSGSDFTACSESIITGMKNEESLNDEIVVFPIPSEDFINIRINNMPVEDVHVIISDVLGRNQMERKFSGGNEKSFIINFSNKLKLGIYFLTVQTGKSVLTKKIILN